MALKTLGGFEVELIETNPPGRPWESTTERGTGHKGRPIGPHAVWPFVDMRRLDTGKIYERFDIAGLRSSPDEVGMELRRIRKSQKVVAGVAEKPQKLLGGTK